MEFWEAVKWQSMGEIDRVNEYEKIYRAERSMEVPENLNTSFADVLREKTGSQFTSLSSGFIQRDYKRHLVFGYIQNNWQNIKY